MLSLTELLVDYLCSFAYCSAYGLRSIPPQSPHICKYLGVSRQGASFCAIFFFRKHRHMKLGSTVWREGWAKQLVVFQKIPIHI